MIIPQKIKSGFGNTRSVPKSQFVIHLDYLRIRTKLEKEKLDLLLEFIGGKYIGYSLDTIWSPGGGHLFYRNKIIGINGIVGGFNYIEDDTKIDVMIDMSGRYFESIEIINQWRILRGLFYAYQCTALRIDIAIDDSTYQKIPVLDMKKAWEEGNNFYFRKYKYIESGRNIQDLKKTHYFGSRESDKMVRIYDHDEECLRFEAEFKKHLANSVFMAIATLDRQIHKEDILGNVADWISNLGDTKCDIIDVQDIVRKLHGCGDDFELVIQKVMGAIAVNCIDFRDKNSRKDRSKASFKDTKRLSFYQEFADKVGIEIKIKPPTRIASMQKTIAWMRRQVSRTMAIIKSGLGIVDYLDWSSRLIEIGKEKISTLDLKLVEYIRKNPEMVRLQ